MIFTDALVIGAGPVGLFQVFQLGLLEIKCHIIDALPSPGGQCIELYPDKPIYDIPGTPHTTGRELTASLLKQAAPFNATLHLGQTVTAIEKLTDGSFAVTTSQGTQFKTKVIVIAAGVGAFQPKKLAVDGLAQFENSQLFYHSSDSANIDDRQVLVIGGDAAGLECSIALANSGTAKSVTLLHRRDVYQAAPALVEQVMALQAAGKLTIKVGQVAGYESASSKLVAVNITGTDAVTQPVPIDTVLVYLGLSPKLGPIAEWGLEMTKKQIAVDTEKFSTSVPGIFAVGDINTYAGKKKLILSGFHECALAAFGAADIVFPGRNPQLEYTTSSTRLHKLLGVGAQGTNHP